MITSLLLTTTTLFGMKTPPIPGAINVQPEKSYLEQQPGDVKKIILAHITAKNPDEAATNIKALARTNKFFHEYINRPDILKFILTTMANQIPDVTELDAAEKLQTMPGMKNLQLQEWLAKRKIEIPKEQTLARAAIENDIPLVIHVLQQGADPNGKDKNSKYTVLAIAASKNYKEIVQKLIDAGADVNALSGIPPSYTPLHFAAQENANESLRILLEARANPNLFSVKLHVTPLSLATERNNAENYKQLLKANAQVNVQDSSGYTPLMWAAYNGNSEIIKDLLKAHANIDTQDNNGVTALIWAIYNNHPSAAKTLITAGANPNLSSRKYGTALELAQKNGDFELIKWLRIHGAKELSEDRWWGE